jgi:hypothetical protein
MSKTEKMRDKLATIQKDRAEFEKKKNELAAQMTLMSNNAKRGKGSISQTALSPTGSSTDLFSVSDKGQGGGAAKATVAAGTNPNPGPSLPRLHEHHQQQHYAESHSNPPSPITPTTTTTPTPAAVSNLQQQQQQPKDQYAITPVTKSAVIDVGIGFDADGNLPEDKKPKAPTDGTKPRPGVMSRHNSSSRGELKGGGDLLPGGFAFDPLTAYNRLPSKMGSITCIGMTAMVLLPAAVPAVPRISDWCYEAPVKSSPPFVKAAQLSAQYEIIRLLGRGSFGDVNLAKDPSTNRFVAACNHSFVAACDHLLLRCCLQPFVAWSRSVHVLFAPAHYPSFLLAPHTHSLQIHTPSFPRQVLRHQEHVLFQRERLRDHHGGDPGAAPQQVLGLFGLSPLC